MAPLTDIILKGRRFAVVWVGQDLANLQVLGRRAAEPHPAVLVLEDEGHLGRTVFFLCVK